MREPSLGGDVCGLERHTQGAASVHGVDRVAAQVHYHLVQLGGIADNHQRPLGGARLETDICGQRAAKQLQRLSQDTGDVDRCALAALAAAISEDLLDETATTGRGGEHVLGIALEWRAIGRFLDEHFAVGEHSGQDIVEVVRDAASEPPDRFHLCGLAQPLLEPLALGLRACAR
jgi:hypothetical protein